MSMKKFLLCTLEYPPQIGGVANYYYHLKDAWPKQSVLDVLDNSNNKLLFKHSFWPWLKSIVAIFKAWRQEKYTLIVIGQILPLGTSAFLLSFMPGFRYALILHGLDYSLARKNPWKRMISSLILKRAKLVIAANTYLQELIVQDNPVLKKSSFILNPAANMPNQNLIVAKEKLIAKHHLENKKVIFSLGRLVRRKGFDYVLKALEDLKDENWVYILSGQGEDETYLQSLIAKHPYRQQIIFLTNLKEEEKWSFLNLCDIFVMPARNIKGDFEGFGIVYLEANLLAKPVIAGDSGGVRDAVVHEQTGLLLDPNNINEITQAIKLLLTNDNLAKDLGVKGQARAIKDFNWPGQAHKLAKIFDSLSL